MSAGGERSACSPDDGRKGLSDGEGDWDEEGEERPTDRVHACNVMSVDGGRYLKSRRTEGKPCSSSPLDLDRR